MKISVHDLLRCKFFQEFKVCGGEKGLDNIIDSVTIWESPVASKYIKGNELVITSGYCILNNIDMQKRIIEDLVSSGAGGLAITLMYYNYELPKVMKETADKYNFPVISIPDHVYYVDIYEIVTNNFFSNLTKEIKKKEDVFKEIDESVYKEGLAGAVKALNKWTGLPAAVLFEKQLYLIGMEQENYRIVNNPLEWKEKKEQRVYKTKISGYQYSKDGHIYEWLGGKIETKNKIDAYIQLIKGEREFSEDDYTLLDYTAVACASEIKRLSDSIEMQRKFHADFFRKFFEGKYTMDEVKYQAYKMGFDLPEDGVVVIVDFSKSVTESINDTESNELFNKKISSLISKVFGKNTLQYLYQNKRCFIFIPYSPEDNKLTIKNLYSSLIEEFGENSANIGISKPLRYDTIKKGINEAQNAIQIGSHLKLVPNIYNFSELGFYRLLNLPEAMGDIISYYQEYIKPLIDYDKENDADLLETLMCYMDNNYNYKEAAKSMFIHPNTARYRITLVEKICRIDLNLPYDRFNMEVAIKLLPLINMENQ